jgi:hypothetical protein
LIAFELDRRQLRFLMDKQFAVEEGDLLAVVANVLFKLVLLNGGHIGERPQTRSSSASSPPAQPIRESPAGQLSAVPTGIDI